VASCWGRRAATAWRSSTSVLVDVTEVTSQIVRTLGHPDSHRVEVAVEPLAEGDNLIVGGREVHVDRAHGDTGPAGRFAR
jgi:ERCC4-type nuclease